MRNLRQLAAVKLANENPGQTLQPTALVHEAFIRLVGSQQPQHWRSRSHFFAAAAEAIRRILIDVARRRRRVKHGGSRQRVALDDVAAPSRMSVEDLLAVDEALEKLTQESPRRAELVKLRFYAGMSIPEAAQALGISHATAERYWTYAKCWLLAELRDPATY